MVDLTQPIVRAPDDYVVDLENPQRRGEVIILWIGIVGTIISTFLLAVRAYTKAVLVKKLSSDDYCLLLAWVFAIPVQLLIISCKPFAKNIDVTITEGQCLNKAALYIATGVLNIITDIMVIILPIPMVLRLQMSRERKIMVIGIFSVGSM
ncbi:uncharacterized protein J4E88_009209 [Alternaria novae-zelandiae]|uniref:uncharacterized protein n=1 Tax=Alternaria novae-zelandiae TaxID=430562 RepID=UPI0020C481FB|nr:uncharacterized protein J4E88_009209 [Alternaria novae-zelandiae]KAI4671176.1 hypothetical protein J4E88_009209 [Alternaria novae-zelandiae]